MGEPTEEFGERYERPCPWQSPSSQVGPEALRGPDPMNPEFRAVLWT